MKVLVVVDMQKDFIDGALGSSEAVSIVPRVVQKIKEFEGKVFYTRDTHPSDYLQTQEGKNLPVIHCVEGTPGWELHPDIAVLAGDSVIDKPTFGSVVLGQKLADLNEAERIEDITLVGLCTDICVISNAMLIKAFLPEAPVFVVRDCCAGVTPKSHERALESMKICQIGII